MNSITNIFRIINTSSRSLRTLSIPGQHIAKMATNASVSEMQKERELFLDVFPSIMDTLLTKTKFANIPHVANWTKKVLEYNLQGGKKNRGLSAALAYEMLEDPEKITEETLRISRVLGWCVEMLQSYLVVVDDMMDGATKRRGIPCWYCLPNVGLGAINDSILIYSALKEILAAYCKHLPQYPLIVDEYDEALLYTTVGQHLDFEMAHRHKKDYSLFTTEKYNSIAKFKTAYYTYKLPVSLGLLLANKTDPETHKKAESICIDIGLLFQMQDDFIDCFGVETLTGKIGNDIQEGKCSWLAVQALQLCSQKQRTVFVSCYGSPEPAHIERVKRLYEELELPALYHRTEKHLYDTIVKNLEQLPPDSMSPKLFIKLLDLIYDRKN